MADTSKNPPANPSADRRSEIPFDKDAVSPLPQFAPRQRSAGAGSPTGAVPLAAAPTPEPSREEYPGPQTASSGERSEPGRRPTSEGTGEEPSEA